MRRSFWMALAATLIWLWGTPAQAKFDPSLRWTTLTTQHFLIHHHQGEEAIAARCAVLAEDIHGRLAPRMGWTPRERTHLVLVDAMDFANGFATLFPANRIVIYLTPPLGETGFGMTPYDDWLRLVITHEYTHILQLDMVDYLPRYLRMILGRFYFPNEFQPLWLIEGLATYEETELTSGGRGRSPASDMVLRMAALEGRFPDLGQASVIPDFWPAGEIPYLFGESYLRFLADRYGREKVAELSRDYSGRWVPFLVNSTARRVLSKYHGALWKEWAAGLKEKYGRQAAAIRAAGLTPSTPLTARGCTNVSPAFSPDGARLAYLSDDADRYPSLRLMNADGSMDRTLADNLTAVGAGAAGLAWDPTGAGIYFTRLEVRRNVNERNDLWYYDLRQERARPLTEGLRAGDPSPSPDGKKLLCTVTALGRTRLALLDLERREYPLGEGDLTYLTVEGDLDFSAPRWSPDGSRIAVIVRQTGGYTDIRILDAAGRAIDEITHDRASDGAPAWSPDGRYIFFSSDRTGVCNLFAWEVETRRLYQVSNVIGGAFCPAVSPDGRRLAFASYGPKGYDLHLMTLDRTAWRPAADYRDPYPSPAYADRPVETTTSSYSPWSTLYPRFWLPSWGYSSASGSMWGFYTLGQDVLERHSWSATALYGPDSGRFNYDLVYVYDGLYPSLSARLSDLDVTHTDLLRAGDRTDDYVEAQRTLDLSATLPLITFPVQYSFTLGYRRRSLEELTDEDELARYRRAPAEGTLASLYLVGSFNSARRYPYSISPEDGRTIQLSYERVDELLGGDFTLDRYTADWQEYLGLPWPHHILKVRGYLGVSDGDRLLQGAFQIGGDSPGDISPYYDQEAVTLRGYPMNSFRGRKASLLSLEYRFPILDIQRGAGTTPFFLRRLHGAVFAEGGEAWNETFRLSETRTGIGAEARLDMTFAYWFPLTLRFVLARGLNDGGEGELYLGLWVPF